MHLLHFDQSIRMPSSEYFKAFSITGHENGSGLVNAKGKGSVEDAGCETQKSSHPKSRVGNLTVCGAQSGRLRAGPFASKLHSMLAEEGGTETHRSRPAAGQAGWGK
jgi:hypothetical protein